MSLLFIKKNAFSFTIAFWVILKYIILLVKRAQGGEPFLHCSEYTVKKLELRQKMGQKIVKITDFKKLVKICCNLIIIYDII